MENESRKNLFHEIHFGSKISILHLMLSYPYHITQNQKPFTTLLKLNLDPSRKRLDIQCRMITKSRIL